MADFHKRHIRKALDLEISRAKRFQYYIGILILDVAETTPRGIHKSLPGITVNIRHFRSILRDYDTVVKAKLRRYSVILPHLDEGESARLVRDRILFTARLHDWGAVNIGVAIFPEDGTTSRELIKAAEKDLQVSMELELEPDSTLM